MDMFRFVARNLFLNYVFSVWFCAIINFLFLCDKQVQQIQPVSLGKYL